MRPLLIAGLLVAVLGCAGCGNKGPLYLPPTDATQSGQDPATERE
ncbi:MAG: lipopeptide [Gammaproteobacteria bacterium]|nr:lipopeptide [Gammaproteobacteria bacterium]